VSYGDWSPDGGWFPGRQRVDPRTGLDRLLAIPLSGAGEIEIHRANCRPRGARRIILDEFPGGHAILARVFPRLESHHVYEAHLRLTSLDGSWIAPIEGTVDGIEPHRSRDGLLLAYQGLYAHPCRGARGSLGSQRE
jgi:hypothetical protein